MTTGTRLKNLRKEHDFTIDSVAALLEVKPDELYEIESNNKTLTVSQLEILSDLYGVDEEYIVEGTKQEFNSEHIVQQDLDVYTTYQINKVLRNIDFLASIKMF